MLKYVTFIYILSLFFHDAHAQQFHSLFKTYTSADGLSLSNVNNVQTDHRGFLWIATNYGLNKFDGANFSRFHSSIGKQVNGLSGNVIKQVLCDSLVIWAAIDNGGVNCYFYQIDNFIHYTHDPDDSGSLVSNAVNCLLLSADKKVYIGTNGGLSIFTREASHFKNIVEHPALKKKIYVTSLWEASDNIIWIGTNQQGLLYYDEKMGVLAVAHIPSILQSTVINDLMYDTAKRELWLATSDGLWCASVNSNHELYEWRQPFSSLQNASIECVKKDATQNIWAGTSTKGVFWRSTNDVVYHFSAGNIDGSGLISNCINDIFCSPDGAVWLSTSKGLQLYQSNLQGFAFFRTDVYFNKKILPTLARGLCLWNKYILAATNQGIWISDTNFLKSINLVAFDGNQKQVQFSNAVVIDDEIFITGSNGVYQLVMNVYKPRLLRPARLKRFKTYITKPCHDIIKVNDSVICLASDKSIYTLNLNTGKADTIFSSMKDYKSTTDKQVITRLYKDKEGRILVGTNKGIAIYNGSHLSFQPVNSNKYTSDLQKENNVNDFYDDGKSIWVTISGSGFFRCGRNLAVLNEYTTENGLCDNTVYCIQPDERGNLWLTTNRGLSVFDTSSKKFLNYYRQHGLSSQEFNLFGKASFNNRTLYFSTADGILQVRSYKRSIPSPSPLHIQITKMIAGNEIMGRSQLAVINEMFTVSLDYGKNVALSFAVINFSNLYEYALQYKLNDSDSWLDMLSGSDIILSKLPAGVHRLCIRGSVKPENIAGEPLTLTLFVKTPYYQQWWFITLLSLLFVVIAYFFYKYRIHQIRKLSNLRTKISQDLHDNIGSALSSISIFSQAAIQKHTSGNMADSKSILEKIGETSREVMSELNDTVWLINPSNDNLHKIIQRVGNYALPLCSSKGIHFEIIAASWVENLDLSVEKRKAIYLIIKEAVNNSLKYASAKKLIIQFEKKYKALHISIKDDGNGLAKSNLSAGNGINNMKQRAKDVHGKINFEFIQQKGTEVLLEVPLTNIGD